MLTTAKLQIRQVQGGFETLTGRPAYSSGSMMAKVSWLVEERASDIWEDKTAAADDHLDKIDYLGGIRGSVRGSKQAINTTL